MDNASGITEVAAAPARVPPVHPSTGVRIRPAIYAPVNAPGCCMDTAKISSVIPNETASLLGILICLSTFCETERDMRKYRILIINVVTASSAIVPPAIRRFVPANCPALVRFVKDINTAAHKGIPESTAVMPKATETEKYPRHTGKPSRSPLINSLFFIIPRSSFIPFSKSLSICANILYWKIYYIDKYILIENLNTG